LASQTRSRCIRGVPWWNLSNISDLSLSLSLSLSLDHTIIAIRILKRVEKVIEE
jgi:hypothetical protein